MKIFRKIKSAFFVLLLFFQVPVYSAEYSADLAYITTLLNSLINSAGANSQSILSQISPYTTSEGFTSQFDLLYHIYGKSDTIEEELSSLNDVLTATNYSNNVGRTDLTFFRWYYQMLNNVYKINSTDGGDSSFYNWMYKEIQAVSNYLEAIDLDIGLTNETLQYWQNKYDRYNTIYTNHLNTIAADLTTLLGVQNLAYNEQTSFDTWITNFLEHFSIDVEGSDLTVVSNLYSFLSNVSRYSGNSQSYDYYVKPSSTSIYNALYPSTSTFLLTSNYFYNVEAALDNIRRFLVVMQNSNAYALDIPSYVTTSTKSYYVATDTSVSTNKISTKLFYNQPFYTVAFDILKDLNSFSYANNTQLNQIRRYNVLSYTNLVSISDNFTKISNSLFGSSFWDEISTPQNGESKYTISNITNFYIGVTSGSVSGSNVHTSWYDRVEALLAALVFASSEDAATNLLSNAEEQSEEHKNNLNDILDGLPNSPKSQIEAAEQTYTSIFSLFTTMKNMFSDIVMPENVVLVSVDGSDSSSSSLRSSSDSGFEFSFSPTNEVFFTIARSCTTLVWVVFALLVMYKFFLWTAHSIYRLSQLLFQVFSWLLGYS